jgi:UDP-N-acetylglucosamine 4-epimerase
LAAISTNPDAHNEVFNVAFGESTNLDELVQLLQELLSEFDPKIANVEIKYGPERIGDVRHSLASIVKSTTLLGYKPEQDLRTGLEKAIAWYWENLH